MHTHTLFYKVIDSSDSIEEESNGVEDEGEDSSVSYSELNSQTSSLLHFQSAQQNTSNNSNNNNNNNNKLYFTRLVFLLLNKCTCKIKFVLFIIILAATRTLSAVSRKTLATSSEDVNEIQDSLDEYQFKDSVIVSLHGNEAKNSFSNHKDSFSNHKDSFPDHEDSFPDPIDLFPNYSESQKDSFPDHNNSFPDSFHFQDQTDSFQDLKRSFSDHENSYLDSLSDHKDESYSDHKDSFSDQNSFTQSPKGTGFAKSHTHSLIKSETSNDSLTGSRWV